MEICDVITAQWQHAVAVLNQAMELVAYDHTKAVSSQKELKNNITVCDFKLSADSVKVL